ncbi:spore protein [Paenibacillus thiaminolyticus]|uniref:Spore protein n=2 Tax=Paenibacillus TaxID=44249 RepID=A0ABT4FW18_PANTH|nr:MULTISPECIES: spore protein [Paenibacillus]MEB9896507.1 spore protein [Bacillus cereus]MCY9534415.1 spore protein [Paenibacillus thiaminolyticus]MCY9602943.1 spore protein [Paenibacillus thiaminolyticus]MCY9608357.1 spore protein [Paenibacillus thiaminolyticus]MCY9616404.1 spore protein [Paenibacillus thiaminolyticus]
MQESHSKEQKQQEQANRTADTRGKIPVDKKLEGPNRPST